MKRFLPCYLILFALPFQMSCKDKALKEENIRISQELAALKQENNVLKLRVSGLEAQIKELSETPAALFERAQKLKGNGLYEAAITALESVVLKASGQPVAQKAQAEISTLNGLIDQKKREEERLMAQKKKEEERAKRDAFTSIGGGFGVRRVNIKSSGYGLTEIIGEIKNDSGESYSIVNITIALYDSSDNLLGNGIANISNLSAGSIRSFTGLADVPSSRIAKYRVQFENAI